MMKISKILYGFLLITFTMIVIISCKDDDELYPQLGVDPKSISEIVEETSELTTFSSALTQSGLDSILKSTTTYTVLAPNNDAFGATTLPTTDVEMENALLNHILVTETPDFTSKMLTGYLSTMALGPDGNNLSLFTNTEGSLKFNGIASLHSGLYDLGATNGIVHTVDAVLTVPTAADHVIANPNFSSFATALDMTDLIEGVRIDSLTTIFAPNNAAFEAFLMEVNGTHGWETLDDIPEDVLEEIVLYHLVTDENIIADDLNETEQTTMQGESFSVEGTEIDDASYTNANIVLQDVQAINGIIHVVDKVLLYEELFQEILDETLNLFERCDDKGYSTFTQAIDKAGLKSSLESDELTAFAPNNDAFLSFFLTIENFDSLDDFDTTEDLELLKSVLEYHLYSGILMDSDLTDGGVVTTINGDSFVSDLSGDKPKLVPSHVDASAATISNANIGASNGMIHEINKVLVSAIDAAALGYPKPVTGAPEFVLPVYYDSVESGFSDTWGGWGGTWDWSSTNTVQNGSTSIELAYDADSWGAMQIGGPSPTPDLSLYSTFHFSGYGAPGTGTTTLFISLCDCDAGVNVEVVEGEWTSFTLPISSFSDTSLGAIRIKNTHSTARTIYVDDIGFDLIVPAAPEFDLPVYYDSVESGFSDSWGGWGGTWNWSHSETVQFGDASIELDYDADSWGAMQIGGPSPALDVSTYSTFNFSAYGASGTGTTTLFVSLCDCDDGVNVEVVEGEWTNISIPVSSFTDTSMGAIRIKNTHSTSKTIYVDNIGFNN